MFYNLNLKLIFTLTCMIVLINWRFSYTIRYRNIHVSLYLYFLNGQYFLNIKMCITLNKFKSKLQNISDSLKWPNLYLKTPTEFPFYVNNKFMPIFFLPLIFKYLMQKREIRLFFFWKTVFQRGHDYLTRNWNEAPNFMSSFKKYFCTGWRDV